MHMFSDDCYQAFQEMCNEQGSVAFQHPLGKGKVTMGTLESKCHFNGKNIVLGTFPALISHLILINPSVLSLYIYNDI